MSHLSHTLRITMATLATAGLSLAVLPAATAVDNGQGGGVPIYCLAPDGKIEAYNPIYEDGVLASHDWYLSSFTPEGMDTPLEEWGPGYAMHPTVTGTIDPSFTLNLDALPEPGQTTEQSNTGDIPFVGHGFRAGDLHSDPHVYTLYVGPSRTTITEICDDVFYDANGNERPGSEMNWGPRYVNTGGGFVDTSLPGNGGNGGGGGSSLSS